MFAQRKSISALPAAALLVITVACSSPERADHVDRSEPPRTLRVAACQTHISGDRAEGLQAVDAALASAASQGAQLACFPETCLFGWVNPEAHALADPIPGPTTDALAELARRHGVMIAVGLAEREGDRLYDSAVLIDSDGELLMKHRKVNILSELMDPPYTPGTSAPASVVDTRLGRIGVLVCADTFHDESMKELAAAEPALVLVPYGWAAPRKDWPGHAQSLHAWIANTARVTGAPVVGVDSTGALNHGPWKGYLCGGQSMACDATGQSLGVLADRMPDVRVFDLEPTAR